MKKLGAVGIKRKRYTPTKNNLVLSSRKDRGQQDHAHSVTLLRYRQQKQRKAKKT